MRKRIRIGNDIEVVWIVNIKDNAGNIADLSSFDLGVDLIVGTKVFNITNACTISGNTITFIYRGSEQIYTGSYVLKLYDATNTSVTYDIKTAFVLVDHSWRAPDVITVPTTVEQTSTVSVSQIIVQRGERGPQGPKGDKGDKGEGAYTLQAASSDELGGIKIGYSQNAKNYPVKLDESNRAFVTVPWVSGGGGGGGGDDDPSGGGSGGNGSYTEMAFKGVSSVGVPTLPENGVELDTTTGWAHSAPNNLDGTLTVWMTTRIVTASGTYNDWQGPWRISGAEGEAGVDGDYYEYIYARTTSESVQPSNPNSGVPDASSSTQTVTADDFIPLGWTDNPQGVTTAYQVEWMAMRLKQHTDANRGGTWSQFIGPVVWSKYGVNGTDGDGVEYIYYAGTQYPATEPSTWTNDEGFQNREYINASAAGNISIPGSGWVDDPFDLTPTQQQNYGGWKQWVCVRKKYIGTGEEEPRWHAYSDPALWSYVGQDGDAGIGVVADIDNDTMAVSLKSTGYNNEFSQTATVTLYNGAATVPSIVGTITVTDNAGTDYTSEGWVTNSGNLITVELDEDEIDLSNKTLLVTIPLTGTVSSESVSRTVVLTIIGVHFGTDGASYRLVLDSPAIRKKKDNTLAPASITPLCVKTLGSEPQDSYNRSELPIGFTFKYSVDGGSEVTLSSNNSIPTTGINDSLRVELDYNNILVDQETIYILHDGADGRYVAAINEYYAVGTSKTISPSGWQLNTIPTYTLDAGDEKYLWNYEVTVFDDGSTYTSTAVVIAILNKSDGISKINNYYLAVATDVIDNSTRVPGGTVNDDGYVTSGVANIGYGWAKNDPSAIIAVVSADKRYMWNFEEIVFESGLHYVSKIHIADRYIVTDVEFIKKAFTAVVDNRNAATLTGYLGVVDSGNTNKIQAMINGSSIGADLTHGKLLISTGFDDLDVNDGTDGTFRVYEDGYVYCKNAYVEGQIDASSGYIGDLAVDEHGINASIQSGSDDFTDITINGDGIRYESYSYSGTHVIANKELWGYFSISSKISHTKNYVCAIDTQTSGIGGLWVSAGDQSGNAIYVNTGNIVLSSLSYIYAPDSSLKIAYITGGVSVMQSSGLSTYNPKRTVIAASGGTLNLSNWQAAGYELDVYVDGSTSITLSVGSGASIETLFGGTSTAVSGTSTTLASGYMYHLVYYSSTWYVSRSN